MLLLVKASKKAEGNGLGVDILKGNGLGVCFLVKNAKERDSESIFLGKRTRNQYSGGNGLGIDIFGETDSESVFAGKRTLSRFPPRILGLHQQHQKNSTDSTNRGVSLTVNHKPDTTPTTKQRYILCRGVKEGLVTQKV